MANFHRGMLILQQTYHKSSNLRFSRSSWCGQTYAWKCRFSWCSLFSIGWLVTRAFLYPLIIRRFFIRLSFRWRWSVWWAFFYSSPISKHFFAKLFGRFYFPVIGHPLPFSSGGYFASRCSPTLMPSYSTLTILFLWRLLQLLLKGSYKEGLQFCLRLVSWLFIIMIKLSYSLSYWLVILSYTNLRV